MPVEVEKLTAFLGVDADGNETGMVGMVGVGPMVFSHQLEEELCQRVLDMMREHSRVIASTVGHTIREVEFTRNRLFNCREYKA